MNLPGIDRVVLWPRQEWSAYVKERRFIALFRAILRLRSELRSRDYDLVIDAQGLLKSAFLAWLACGSLSIGFRSKEPTGLFLNKRIDKRETSAVCSEYLGLAQYLGWETRDFSMVLGVSSEDSRRAAAIVESARYIAIAPFTTRPQKHWTRAHWRQLIERLVAQGFSVACLGGPSDRQEARRLLEGLTVQNWVGEHPLGVSAALISTAQAVIGVDTGLTHMGIASNTPTVALFGSTCPYLETGRENVEIIYQSLDCAPCQRHPTCGGAYTCLSSIDPSEVLKRLMRVIGETSRGGNAVPT